MRKISSILYFLLFFTITGVAQIPYQETVPDIRYPVSGQKKLSMLSNDDGLFTILAFEDDAAVSWETDWEGYILKARDLFESGQEFAAQRIVSDCLRHGRWSKDFSLEAHKAIPIIVASMERDEMYSFYVGEIKHRFNLGILSEEDVAPFKSEFSRIHMKGDKDLGRDH